MLVANNSQVAVGAIGAGVGRRARSQGDLAGCTEPINEPSGNNRAARAEWALRFTQAGVQALARLLKVAEKRDSDQISRALASTFHSKCRDHLKTSRPTVAGAGRQPASSAQ